MSTEMEKTSTRKRIAGGDKLERTRPGKVFIPAVDIFENENEFIVVADMPGTNEKAIDIVLEQNVLNIQARVEPALPQGFDLQYAEYESGDYQRSFSITDRIDREKIDANFSNGVLRLKLPKVEPARPRKIAVKSI